MSLDAALTAYAELIGDTLVNGCGAPEPSRVLRYHGHGVPDDISCDGTDTGILSVWWDTMLPGSTRDPCQGVPSVYLHARWVICWKLAQADSGGITLEDATWDTDAALLAAAAECVARALLRLSCGIPPVPVDGEDEAVAKARALVTLAQNRKVEFVSAAPVGVSGGIAGVEWTVELRLRGGATETS